jgi:hypothetical protein
MPKPSRPEEAKAVEAKAEPVAEYSGQYKYLRDGRIFGLKILPEGEVRMKKTHHAKSADGSFGDYTEAEFRAQFDKL